MHVLFLGIAMLSVIVLPLIPRDEISNPEVATRAPA